MDVVRIKTANTRFGRKVVVEFDESQVFLPDRINNSIIDNIDRVDQISTHRMKFQYLGFEQGAHKIDLWYDHCSQWEHRKEYGAIPEKE